MAEMYCRKNLSPYGTFIYTVLKVYHRYNYFFYSVFLKNQHKIGIISNMLGIYLEFGAAHNSIGSVVTLSNDSPQQSTIMIIISTMITGIGCFAQNIPHLKTI